MRDELTLKELILAIRDYLRYFLRKWYWTVLGGVVVGGLFFYNAWTTPVKYSAPLTFIFNEESPSKMGAGALLGSLGLGSEAEGRSNAMKLLELGKSRQVISRVLFDSIVVYGKNQLIADHIIEIYNYHDGWEESESMRGFLFGSKFPVVDDRAGNRALKSLHNLLVHPDNGLMSITVDELSGVFKIEVSTSAEELSLAIANSVYRELADYFITSSIADKESTLRKLKQRADSVSTVLQVAEANLARFQDRIGLAPLRQSSIRAQQLNREVAILSTMYGEIVKNRETAAFLLANEKPAFNLVDEPLVPLQPLSKSIFKSIVLGGLLGGILVVISQFFVKLYLDTMVEGGEISNIDC